ncbi:MAG: type 1 glutamine amidotransferase [Propionibacteriaceae bacterium]
MLPRVLAVQHSADDPPGRLGDWLADAGCELDIVRCFLGEPLPESLTPYAGLVVLGGAMGAYDDAAFPWLTRTKALLQAGVDSGLSTLGICLGHQLLAVACSGRVAVAPSPQVGLTKVGVTALAGADPLFTGLAVDPVAVHWNNDLVVEAPPGAVVLSRSTAGIQAYRLGSRAWGVQFHPEVDVETVREWARSDVESGLLTADRMKVLLDEVATNDEQLQDTWRAFAERFADQVKQVRA